MCPLFMRTTERGTTKETGGKEERNVSESDDKSSGVLLRVLKGFVLLFFFLLVLMNISQALKRRRTVSICVRAGVGRK